MKPVAILWDYDGTLINSCHKNMVVNRELFTYFNPNIDPPKWPEALTSIDKYQQATCQISDWRDLYHKCFGLSQEQTLQAGEMWRDYQLKNQTPLELFGGIPEIVRNFSSIAQGICSLNDTQNIQTMLKGKNLDDCFQAIVGHDRVDLEKQKPHPEAFFLCLNEMQIEDKEGVIFYIGDNMVDVHFARNAEQSLRKHGKNFTVKAIAASYSGTDPSTWEMSPDYVAKAVADIAKFIPNL